MAAPDRFICCTDVQAPEGEQALLCDFQGQLVPGELRDGCVACQPPALEGLADVEQQGLRLRVTTKAGRVLAESVLPAQRLGAAGAVVVAGDDDDEDKEGVASAALEQEAGAEGAQSQARASAGESRLREKYSALKPFIIISLSYLLFTVTDGAVRMIVLLHAYQKGFSAMQVAIMFSLYELAGVVTNLAAGMLGARWGIKTTLLSGLTIQLAGLGMLFGWQDSWSKTAAIVYVTAAQMLCGIAKDLTKLGGKTVTKLVTPEEKQSSLFKLVSFITGWKNSLKGAGYFLGAATVGVSYYLALGILCGFILAAMPWAAVGLTQQLGRTRKENVRLSALFKNKHNVNVLSLSRIFLFGARDLWFEVPLPFFLRSPASGIGWSRALTGAFLAIFIIVYGQVQSWTPQLVLQPLRLSPPTRLVATAWATLLAVPTAVLGGIMLGSDVFGPDASQPAAIAALTLLLYAFCVVFAVNSAVHSYLIVRYSEGDKVAMNIGAYYCANAVGRLVGTLASGALYSYAGSSIVDGFGACLLVSVAFCALSTVIDLFLEEEGEAAWVPRWLRSRQRRAGAGGGPALRPVDGRSGGRAPTAGEGGGRVEEEGKLETAAPS